MTTHREYRATNPGALIAALPAVLGFVPEKSMVLVGLEEGRMGGVMRVDLSSALADGIGELSEVAAASGADAVVAVVVDADGALCPMCNDEHRQLCDLLGAALVVSGVRLSACYVVDRVQAGGTWCRLDSREVSGAVEDPNASPLAAAAVLEGRRLYRRRAELQGVVAPCDPVRAAAMVGLLEAQETRRESSWRLDPDGCGRRDVEAAMAAAGRMWRGAQLSDEELAELGCALTDVVVRDTLYALAVGADAGKAETLWAAMSRALPEPWRVEALVLLAFSAYARGDGPLAGISLEAALRADPEHRMAGMLDTALQSGMRPESIRELAGAGYRLAKRLGVRLPPRQGHGRWAV